ncbi:hypothetical protein [Mycobacterium sp. M23085]
MTKPLLAQNIAVVTGAGKASVARSFLLEGAARQAFTPTTND